DPDDRACRRHGLLAGGRRDRGRLGSGRGERGVPPQAGGARGGDRARRGRAVILLVDNYDSFTYNLAHLFGELGAEVVVKRNDEEGLVEVRPGLHVYSVDTGRRPPSWGG